MQKIISFFMAIITFFASLFGITLPNDKYDVYKDISYGEASIQCMDIYVPKTAYGNEYNGCVLFIHGGSWLGGDKKEMKSDCEALAEKGYIAATMNYTLYSDEYSGINIAEIMMNDVGTAIEKIKAFSSEKGLNITKLATSGYSAGGHISMLFSYSRPQSSAIELVFTANRVGPASFDPQSWPTGDGLMGYGLASTLSGIEVTEEMIADGSAQAVVDLVSPVYYVNENTIPSLFAYGGKDALVNIHNGEMLKQAFENCGAKYDYIVFPNSNHDLGSDKDKYEQYNAVLADYLETYFGY